MADDFDFVETDSAKLYTTIIESLMDNCQEALYPGDERRIFGEALVAVLVSVFSMFNDEAKQRTLQYARGSVLDAIGERYNLSRIEATSATAVFRFSVSDARDENIVIPAGTRITSDGSVYFATQETAVLSAGDAYVDIVGACSVAGTSYNGVAPGIIATLVDLIPYIAGVSNITETAGGTEGEPYTDEGDEAFRERIRLAPAALSTAGPESAYRYFVKSADSNIIDVAVVCPEDQPNVVNLYPLMTGGELPGDDILQKVLAALSDDVRPMTDKVNAIAPTEVEYEIELKYYTTKSNESATIEAIEGEGGAIEQFKTWQAAALGRAINPDELRYYLRQAGALRVDVVKPTYAELSKMEVAKFTGAPVVTHEVVAG